MTLAVVILEGLGAMEVKAMGKKKKVKVKICRFCEHAYWYGYDSCPECGWPQYDIEEWEVDESDEQAR